MLVSPQKLSLQIAGVPSPQHHGTTRQAIAAAGRVALVQSAQGYEFARGSQQRMQSFYSFVYSFLTLGVNTTKILDNFSPFNSVHALDIVYLKALLVK